MPKLELDNPNVFPAFMLDLQEVPDSGAHFERMKAGLEHAEKVLQAKEEDLRGRAGYLQPFKHELAEVINTGTVSGILARLDVILVRMRYLQAFKDNLHCTVRMRHVLLADKYVEYIDLLAK